MISTCIDCDKVRIGADIIRVSLVSFERVARGVPWEGVCGGVLGGGCCVRGHRVEIDHLLMT